MTQRQSQVKVFNENPERSRRIKVGSNNLTMEQSELLPIKQFSQLCRSTPRTLRFYERYGLIRPAFIDPVTKYRYYNPYQAREFFKVKLLQNFHIPLREIHKILPYTTYETFIQPQLEKLQKDIIEKQKEYKFLKKIKSFLFTTKDPKTFMEKEVFGPYVLLCTREEKGRYDRINAVIYRLFDLAKSLKIPITQRQMVFYLDPVAYKPKDTRLEMCLITKLKNIPKKTVPPNYYFRQYPKTAVRLYSYKGPYEYITLVYQKIHEDHPLEKPLAWKNVGFDLHLSGPWNKKSVYDFVTKIAFPA